ncbi:hypothetical protein L596_019377 [Steinernema carpocapsae]|uniref:Plasma membrane proteolipid 3 n=1 Tax=Steinernema carpocapsae TaxID=34508 RepID=A0A4U5MR86_STECR|nr:hypothetical protein L596_019377 [Steinernema carpocapsae]
MCGGGGYGFCCGYGGFGSSKCGALFLCPWVFLCSPFAVALEFGCGSDLVVNLLLSSCFIFPGVLHAAYLIYFSPSDVYVVETPDRFEVLKTSDFL